MGDLKIVVAGCVAQQEGQQLLRRVPEVDLVMGKWVEDLHCLLVLILHHVSYQKSSMMQLVSMKSSTC